MYSEAGAALIYESRNHRTQIRKREGEQQSCGKSSLKSVLAQVLNVYNYFFHWLCSPQLTFYSCSSPCKKYKVIINLTKFTTHIPEWKPISAPLFTRVSYSGEVRLVGRPPNRSSFGKPSRLLKPYDSRHFVSVYSLRVKKGQLKQMIGWFTIANVSIN